MPLLVSPIDNTTPMQQIKRDGVEIDRCPVSGGIWLDRGELEKLLSLAQEAFKEDRTEYREFEDHRRHSEGTEQYTYQQREREHPRSYSNRVDDDDRGYEDHYNRKHGKKSKLKTFFDMFDFD